MVMCSSGGARAVPSVSPPVIVSDVEVEGRPSGWHSSWRVPIFPYGPVIAGFGFLAPLVDCLGAGGPRLFGAAYRKARCRSDTLRRPSCSRAPGSIRTENAVQQAIAKFSNSATALLSSFGWTFLAAKISRKSPSSCDKFCNRKKPLSPCDHGAERTSSYHPNLKCTFCSDAPQTPASDSSSGPPGGV